MPYTERTSYSERQVTERMQHKCQFMVYNGSSFGPCGKPAATSCTDSVVKSGRRMQSQMRYGCLEHPVVPLYHYADGRATTWEEFKRANP